MYADVYIIMQDYIYVRNCTTGFQTTYAFNIGWINDQDYYRLIL